MKNRQMKCVPLSKLPGFLLLWLLVVTSGLSAQQFEYFATQVAGTGASNVRVEVVDATATTGHEYRVSVTASGDDLVYSVENTTTQVLLAENILAGTTSPVFEGIQVTLADPQVSQYNEFM